MDILTKRGQVNQAQTRHALNQLTLLGHCTFLPFPDATASVVDGVETQLFVIRSLYEIKTRYVTKEKFFSQWGYRGMWMMDLDKAFKIANLSKLLQIPCNVYVHLAPSGIVLREQLCDATGTFDVVYESTTLETPRSINGGTEFSKVLLFDMTSANQINIRPLPT